jgi:apolipoprotein N-acyltransferase
VILAGTIRLTRTPTDVPSVRVAAISYPRELFERGEVTRIIRSEVRDDEERVLRDKVRRLQDWFVERTSSEARAGARIVVWPELNLLVFKEDEPAFLERARRLAAEERIYLLMGMAAVHPGTTKPLENKAVLVNPSGSTEFAYHKSHLMPGWEARLVAAGGLRMPIATTSYGRVGAAICADGDYPDFIRQAGQGAADLLLLPTNDWAEIKNVHLHMAVFRAIENGMPVVRATSTGFSAVIDALGRVVAMTDHFAPGVHVTVAQVPLRRVETIYARVGDLFSWLCVAALAVLAAISRVQG